MCDEIEWLSKANSATCALYQRLVTLFALGLLADVETTIKSTVWEDGYYKTDGEIFESDY